MEFKRPFTEIEWTATPPAVRQYIEMLEKSILHLTETIADLKGRTEKLERRVNMLCFHHANTKTIFPA